MPPTAHNKYDFIMADQKKSKKPNFSLPNDGSAKQKMIVFFGLIGVLLIFFLVIFMVASRGGENKTMFLSLLRQQTELARVAGLGASEPSVDQSLQNVSANVQLVVASDSQQLQQTLAAKKITFKPKDIAKSVNAATDTSLTEAKAAANFTSIYISILDAQLTDYEDSLQDAYNKTGSKSIKETLTKNYDHAQELKKQLSASQQ